MLVHAVSLLDLDRLEAGGGELAAEVLLGERAGDAAGPLLPCPRRVASSMSGSATTSLTAKRPPGRSTRAASRNTRGLSAERLITQLLMITSTDASGSGISSIVALEELDVLGPGLALVLARELEHLVGHVEAVGLAGRTDALRREQHVQPAAGPEVEHRLALVQLGDGGGVAAAERGQRGLLGHRLVAVLRRAEDARRPRAAWPPQLGPQPQPSWPAALAAAA